MFNKIKAHTIDISELTNMYVIMDMDDRYHYRTTLSSEFDVLGLIAHDEYRPILDYLHNGGGVGAARSKFGLLPNARPEICTLQDLRGAFRSGSGDFDKAGDQSLHSHGCSESTAKWVDIDLSDISTFDELFAAFHSALIDWIASASQASDSFKGESIMIGCDVRIPNTCMQTHDIAKGIRINLKPSVTPMYGLESYFIPELGTGGPHFEDSLNRAIGAYRSTIAVRFRMYHVKPVDNDLSDNKGISTLLTDDLGSMGAVSGEQAFHRTKLKIEDGRDSESPAQQGTVEITPYEETLALFIKMLSHDAAISERHLDMSTYTLVDGLKRMLLHPGLTSELERMMAPVPMSLVCVTTDDKRALSNRFNMPTSAIDMYIDIYRRLQLTDTLSKGMLMNNKPAGMDNSDKALQALSVLRYKLSQPGLNDRPNPLHSPVQVHAHQSHPSGLTARFGDPRNTPPYVNTGKHTGYGCEGAVDVTSEYMQGGPNVDSVGDQEKIDVEPELKWIRTPEHYSGHHSGNGLNQLMETRLGPNPHQQRQGEVSAYASGVAQKRVVILYDAQVVSVEKVLKEVMLNTCPNIGIGQTVSYSQQKGTERLHDGDGLEQTNSVLHVHLIDVSEGKMMGSINRSRISYLGQFGLNVRGIELDVIDDVLKTKEVRVFDLFQNA